MVPRHLLRSLPPVSILGDVILVTPQKYLLSAILSVVHEGNIRRSARSSSHTVCPRAIETARLKAAVHTSGLRLGPVWLDDLFTARKLLKSHVLAIPPEWHDKLPISQRFFDEAQSRSLIAQSFCSPLYADSGDTEARQHGPGKEPVQQGQAQGCPEIDRL